MNSSNGSAGSNSATGSNKNSLLDEYKQKLKKKTAELQVKNSELMQNNKRLEELQKLQKRDETVLKKAIDEN